MRAYRDLLATPEARWPLITSTIHRLTPGMMVLAMVLLLLEYDYTYTIAGLTTGAHQVGVALASPLQGRLADRFGPPRVLIVDGLLYLAGTVAFVVAVNASPEPRTLVGIAMVAGIAFPPTTACSRVVLSRLFPTGQLRDTAFAVSTIAVELGFIVGPLTAVVLAEGVGAGWAVISAGIAGAIGAVGFASTGAAAAVPRRASSRDLFGALRSPGIRVMVVSIGAIAVAFGVFDIVVPAYAAQQGQPRAAGLISAIAAGSAIGGLIYGGRSWPGTLVQRLCVLGTVFSVGLLLVPVSLASISTFAVALFLSGLFLGPTLISAFQLIDDLAIPGTQTEAQQWTQATVLFGVAAGAAVSGLAVDLRGPAAAFVGGAIFVGLGVALLIIRRRRLVPVQGPDAPREREDSTTDQGIAPPIHVAPVPPPAARPSPQSPQDAID